MSEASLEPDWVIGTSIGAINAALIPGNPPEKRAIRLREFWRRMDRGLVADAISHMPFMGPAAANVLTIAPGLRGFFAPTSMAFAGANVSLRAERAGFAARKDRRCLHGGVTRARRTPYQDHEQSDRLV